MPKPFIIAAGEQYGLWTVLGSGNPDKWNHPRLLCRCRCGRTSDVPPSHLKSGRSAGCRSCGVLTHGATKGKGFSPEYKIWKGIIQRCHNPKSGGFYLYGGRGIHVCDGWRGVGGYEAFLAHLGSKPSPQHEIDRIDSNGHYEPGNVRWSTRKEQARNLRRNVFLTAHGQTKQISQWAEDLKIPKSTIRGRLSRGKSPEQAVEIVA